MPGISVLILTKNEEQNLPACLESVSWCDDVHIYDSMSTDATVAIAESAGATVTQRGYEDGGPAFGGDEAAHRNWGLENIGFKHPWVLQLDADERCNPALAQEIRETVSETPHSAYVIRRRDFLGSTWLRHVQASPYYVRLFRPEKVRYKRVINCTQVVDGSTGRLASYFDHFPFSKGLDDWIDKHNEYSALEARQILSDREAKTSFSLKKAIAASDFHERRRHQKGLFHRLPFRPAMRFLVLYVGRRGFLDGRAGYTYARLQAVYEYFIVLKTRELEKRAVR